MFLTKLEQYRQDLTITLFSFFGKLLSRWDLKCIEQ